MSKIEWTDKTWNPVTGCTPISGGCAHCYAKRMAQRLKGRCGYPAEDPFAVTLHEDRLDQPARWVKPRQVFVCSMGDLFHADVPDEFIDRVFSVICECRGRHTFQILTKRPVRMLNWFDRARRVNPGWFSPHTGALDLWETWLGVSVEDQAAAKERIPLLLETPAAVRFVSCEPLLGWLDLVQWLPELDWVIVGGENGPGARPMELEWARAIRDQCRDFGVPFFFKQAGSVSSTGAKTLDGQEWREMPETSAES